MYLSLHRRQLIAVILCLLVAIGFWLPAFFDTDATGFGDWQWFHHSWEVGRVSLLQWGEWPLWDSYHCGGTSMWAQPQAQVFSPTWMATGLLFGTTWGHKIFLVLHAWVGIFGMAFYCRRIYEQSRLASFFTAIIWGCSGYFAWHGAGGHSTFLAFYYAPWLMYFWRRATDDIRYSAAVALLMFLVLLEGGHYPFPFFVLLLGFDALTRLGPKSSNLRIIRGGITAGVLTALLGAMRIIPIFLALQRHPRVIASDDHLTLAEMLEIFTAREHPWQFEHHTWVWPEYGNFLGYTVLFMIALGAVLALTERRYRSVLLGALIFFAASMGSVAWYFPWPLLHELPIYNSLHVPSRFLILFNFYGALLAGLALQKLERKLADWRPQRGARALPKIVPWTILIMAITDIAVVNLPINDRWHGPPLADPPNAHFHLVREPNYLDRYANYPRANLGTSHCYDPLPWDVSPHLWHGETPQVRVVPSTAGSVVDQGRSNIRIHAEASLEEEARLVFNQNYAPDWQFDEGSVVNHQGLLAIDLPAGDHKVDGLYHPADLPVSLSATALGLICCGLLVGVEGRRRKRARREG